MRLAKLFQSSAIHTFQSCASVKSQVYSLTGPRVGEVEGDRRLEPGQPDRSNWLSQRKGFQVGAVARSSCW